MTDAEKENVQRGKARSLLGTVVAGRMEKTITVLINRRIRHRLYGKYITRSSRFHVHDEDGECRVGDKVMIAACRPLSKTKSWRLLRIVERAERL